MNPAFHFKHRIKIWQNTTWDFTLYFYRQLMQHLKATVNTGIEGLESKQTAYESLFKYRTV